MPRNVFMQQSHLTLKIYKNEGLHPIIRLGEENSRTKDPEKATESGFYKLFNERQQNYIFVHNIDKWTNKELEEFKGSTKQIKARAENHGYKTFLTMPINLGEIHTGNEEYDNIFRTSSCLGFIGLDRSKPYSFGSIPKHQIDCLATIVDSLPEIVKDYQKLLNERGK